MDELVYELEQLTDQLVQKLDSSTFEKIGEFVNQRQEILNKMKLLQADRDQFNKHKETVARILKQDAQILARMNALKGEASQALNKISSSRQQKNAYAASYTSDGLYFDKKK